MMRTYLLGLAVATFGCAASPSAQQHVALDDDVMCIGPADAQRFAVYLHGVDTQAPGPQESSNRAVLAHAAQALSMRFAAPRAQQRCGDESCWGFRLDGDERKAAAAAAERAAAACFPPKVRYGLLGFSNGGYLVLSLLRHCELTTLLPATTWAVTVGSTMMKGPLEAEPTDLSGCGRATLLIGTDDVHNADPTDNYLTQLRAKHAAVDKVEFAGGHELPERALIEQLAQLEQVTPH